MAADQGAAGGAAASSLAGFTPQVREPERRGGGGGEILRGAEAMLDVPQKGNNVSSLIITANLIRSDDRSVCYIHHHGLPAEGVFTDNAIYLFAEQHALNVELQIMMIFFCFVYKTSENSEKCMF